MSAATGVALMDLALDDPLDPAQLDRVREIEGIIGARLAQL
jgi:hypothetical protein